MAWFGDGTWHECRAHAWQRNGGGWLVFLQWVITDDQFGREEKFGEWYVFDDHRVKPAGPGKP